MDTYRVDKEVLYNTMSELNTNFGRALQLDYGDISGQEQDWECVPGEEASSAKSILPP